MAYNQNLPADTTAPTEIRENFRALKDDKIVAAASANTADSAVKLANPRTISLTGDATGSATFDGSADMSIFVDVISADTASVCTGNSATATKLETARAINGVSFDGTADITIPASVPVGTVIWYAAATPPNGFLECNGQSTIQYPELAAIVGSNVPDLRGEFIRGWDHEKGTDKERSFGSSQLDAYQGHWHDIRMDIEGGLEIGTRYYVGPTGNGKPSQTIGHNWVVDSTTDGVNGSPRTASETRPRNVALLACIKY